MGFNISLIDVLKILAVGMLLIAILFPRKKGYEYNSLDKKGVILNVVLSIIYVPLSLIGIFTIFLADAPTTDYSVLKKFLLDMVVCIGLFIPILSIASILVSAITRKRGNSKFSFIIQFLPIPVFVIMMILVLLMFRI